jgi:hypothetical protein
VSCCAKRQQPELVANPDGTGEHRIHQERRVAPRIPDQRRLPVPDDTRGGQKPSQRECLKIEIPPQRGVRREQYLKAVVEHEAIAVRGADAATDLGGPVDDPDRATGALQFDGADKAGHTSADDDNGSGHSP